MPRESTFPDGAARHAVLAAAICCFVGACTQHRDATDSVVADHAVASVSADSSAAACDGEVRNVVETFGRRLRLVSVLAPTATARRSVADAYGDLAAPDLLTAWQRDPRSAPGRDVSSPWPARIEIRSLTASGDACHVDGDVIYVTSADTVTALDRRPITLTIAKTDRWRVIEYDTTARNASPAAAAASPAVDSAAITPADVVLAYYADIRAKNYAAAYQRWGRHGNASGKSASAFADGFKDTRTVAVTIGDSARIEGAAGSQFATIPVTVDAELSNGTRQHFVGTYTLRRVMVDGAPPEDRRWHIESAELKAR